MIRTDRLCIYPAPREQMEAMIASEQDEELKKEYTEMLEGCLWHPNQWDWYAMWMIEKTDGTHIGDLCFKGLRENGIAEIGYGILAEHQGQGYATEAVQAACRWSFQHPQVKSLEAETDAGNAVSQVTSGSLFARNICDDTGKKMKGGLKEMAGVEWKGAKCKGGGQAKGVLRHTDKGERLKREHENPDIDRDKTEQNFSYRGLTYGQKCKRYDEQVASAKVKRQSTGKNANTTMVGWVFYLPKGLQKEDHTDPEVVKSWFRDLGDLLNKRYGADFIDMDVHVDEVHLYKDARSGEWEWSRIHGHGAVVPVIEVDGERVLNGKQFCSRKNIKSLNQAIHEMSMEKYGVPYMENADKKKDNEKLGEKSDKKMDRRSISQLKAESAKKLMEAEVAIAERERALDEKEQALNDRAKKQAIRQKKQEANKKVLDDTIQDLRERSVKIRDREGRVAERETDVDAKSQEQEEREKEFQKREDALEAQTRFLDEREQAVSEREAENQELILLGRRVKAGQISEGIQSEEHGERRLPDISSIGYGG